MLEGLLYRVRVLFQRKRAEQELGFWKWLDTRPEAQDPQRDCSHAASEEGLWRRLAAEPCT